MATLTASNCSGTVDVMRRAAESHMQRYLSPPAVAKTSVLLGWLASPPSSPVACETLIGLISLSLTFSVPIIPPNVANAIWSSSVSIKLMSRMARERGSSSLPRFMPHASLGHGSMSGTTKVEGTLRWPCSSRNTSRAFTILGSSPSIRPIRSSSSMVPSPWEFLKHSHRSNSSSGVSLKSSSTSKSLGSSLTGSAAHFRITPSAPPE
mmetsp:Transcript_86484/g.244359  ORF Transcript_86484/g.244359 Transcript_86484/m.244359 type:complete len:208 (+) Transcript_86484:2010-2633(+)